MTGPSAPLGPPPPHVRVLRWCLLALVLAVIVAALLAAPWDAIATALDPWVDGPRREVWG